MKTSLFLIILFFQNIACYAYFANLGKPEFTNTDEFKEGNPTGSVTTKSENTGLWLLTAKITQSSTLQEDVLESFMAGNLKWEKEKHVTIKTMAWGQITAVIENMAVDPANEFDFSTDPGVPKSLTVSGEGSRTESSNYTETIGGTLHSADISNFNVSGAASSPSSLEFHYTDDSKWVEIGVHIDAKGSDKRRSFYDEWKDWVSEYENYYVPCQASCDASSNKNCTITKTAKGYRVSYKISENEQKNITDGTSTYTSESSLELTISPYKEPDQPEVTLYGCSEPGTEEQSNVMASGKPEGGKFRFWVEPANLLTVQPDGESSVNLTGSTPGKGTLYVEYTSPEGKTNTATQPASCVKIVNYNAGNAIPQIPLYDINGKKTSGKLTIPYSSEPDEAYELVDFVSGNPSIITVVASADNLDLQGVKTGKTTLNAKTNCGSPTGPTVEVEVVNCDKETMEALEKMRKGAVENIQEAAGNLQKIAGLKEFEKARDDLVLSTVELLGKAGMTIVTSGGTPSAIVNTVTTIAEATAAVSEMISSGSLEEFYTSAGKAASGELFDKAVYTHYGEKIGEAWGKSLSAIIGVIEVYQAAKRFGENAGQILKHESVLKNAMENWEKADKDFKRIEQLQQICKGDNKTDPKKQEEPKKKQTPDPTKPTPPKEPKPKTDPPPAQEQPKEEPTTPEPEDKEPPTPPTPPATEPRQVGLPYSPKECGCDNSKSIAVSSAGFSSLQSGIKNLADCVEKFSLSVNDYSKALGEITAVTDTLKAALDKGPAIFKVKAKEAKPQLDSLIERTKSYGVAGKTFMKQFEKCPESVTTGMEVLKSAVNVTVDSIKTNY